MNEFLRVISNGIMLVIVILAFLFGGWVVVSLVSVIIGIIGKWIIPFAILFFIVGFLGLMISDGIGDDRWFIFFKKKS